MSDNLNNEIKRPLFANGSITVTTSGGDITPTLIQPAQSTGQEKYNLDQRDSLSILLYALTGTVTAGATLTVKYYNRVPNAIADSILLATETKTLAEITVGNYLATEFTNAALELADYFTVESTLKQAVGSNYTVTANVIVKKKIDEAGLSPEQLSLVTTAVVCIPADRMKGGTAPAYQSLVVSSYPYIVKKFLNATTNTAYFDICLPQIKDATNIRYRIKYILTESTAPTAGQTTIFTLPNSATVTKTYAGTETQNTIITTDWTNAVSSTTTGLLTVTGTYAQNIGILGIDVEYTRG